MKKVVYVVILFFTSIWTQNNEYYEQLITETVTEEYCNNIISNITKLLEEGYVFTDFFKAPIQPNGNESYKINQVDLIQELNEINVTNRTFYDFIRDIISIKKKQEMVI